MPIAYTPRIPEKSLSPDFWTYQDAVEWLLDFYGRTTASARDMRMCKRAVDNAYRELAQAHNWRFYRAAYTLHTDADYDTGTITYDHTGGTYERMLTLASGTWPANAAYGELKLSGYGAYPVEARKSDTVITLSEDQNPGIDIAAGTSYKWWRSAYPLPLDFQKMADPLDETDGWGIPGLRYMEPEQFFGLSRWWGTTTVTNPGCYTMHQDRRTGLQSLWFGEPPADVRSYGFQYIRRPRPLRVTEYATGTATVVSGSTALEGTGTTWTADHVGCVFRLSSTATEKPTSPVGSHDGIDNPAALTRIVASRTDADTMVLDAASDVSKSTCRYTLSDPIDIDWPVMGTYFQRLATYHLGVLTNDVKNRGELKELVVEAFLDATGADQRQVSPGHSPFNRRYPWLSGTVVTNMDAV